MTGTDTAVPCAVQLASQSTYQTTGTRTVCSKNVWSIKPLFKTSASLIEGFCFLQNVGLNMERRGNKRENKDEYYQRVSYERQLKKDNKDKKKKK